MTPFFQFPVPWTESTQHLPSEAKDWTSHFVLALLLVVVVWGVAERIRARRNPPPESRAFKRRRRNRDPPKPNSADSA